MGIIELTKKFDRLPEIAKREVEDFIDFLEKNTARAKKDLQLPKCPILEVQQD